MSIKENLARIQENIASAAQKSGRTPQDITLVAVSKTIPIERIREAFDCGITTFGENRVQELLPKCESLPQANWHMIGHLQTNKVKFVTDKVKLIHSVDSLRLAQEINKRTANKPAENKPNTSPDTSLDILIEINIAQEDTKQGVAPENALFLIEQISTLPNICTKGLMCIAPYVEHSEENRLYFEKMYRLFVDIRDRSLHNVDMQYLSMGMTGDYEVAIEEGANIIRVGTGLFGRR